jgi:hypothetical protein
MKRLETIARKVNLTAQREGEMTGRQREVEKLMELKREKLKLDLIWTIGDPRGSLYCGV